MEAVPGSDEAQQAVEDWIQKLEGMDWPLDETVPGWRQLTLAVAARLATRITNR